MAKAKRRSPTAGLGMGVAMRRVLDLPPRPKTAVQLRRDEELLEEQVAVLISLGKIDEARALWASGVPKS
jgi:hypothetical protein